ncbi:MAG: hypothetical protein ACXVJZ_18780 [Acidimicrobiia bacterium]
MGDRIRIRAGALVAAAVVVAIGVGIGSESPDPAGARDSAPPRARSVLVITVPATSWRDIRDTKPPNLTRLFRHSALADLSTRTVRNRTEAGPGNLVVGTGARSLAPGDEAATNLAADERFDGQRAGAVFSTQTGRRLTRAVGALAWPQLVSANDKASYGAIPGELGQTLEDKGFGRFVIANADEQDANGPVLHREAAVTLMDRHGRVPGRVDGLLVPDPTAAYGLRLDAGAVDAAFPRDFATRRQVVTVDLSDLARADAYRPLATGAQRDVLHRAAMARSDELVGRLLRHVDLHRDAVVVVAPFHSSRARTLTVAAIHAPGRAPGTVESSTTRRAGFLQIVDIAPTVLDLVGVERPDAMEGRPAEYHAGTDTYRQRLDSLVRADRAAQFRDATIGQTTAILVTITITLSVVTAAWFLFGRTSSRRIPLALAMRFVCLGFLGYVFATFVVGAFPVYLWGTAAYFALVTGIAVAFAGGCLALGRRHPLDALLIALGLVIVLHLGDLLTGAHLELNTVFGYTPTVGIRLAGIGNPGSAEVSAAALLFAILVTTRAPRRGRVAGYGVLLATLLVVGAPIWGQDYGGALALGPTIVLWWLLLRGRPIRLRALLTVVGVLLATGIVAGLVDLTRPANSRTHVGRLFEKIGNDGPGAFFTVVGRKWSLMVGTFSNTAWVLAVLSVVILLAVAARRTEVFSRLVAYVPSLRPGLICFALLVALATLLNDSGVQVTGMMAATLLPVLVFLATRLEVPVEAGLPAGQSPARSVSQDRIPA